MGAEGPDHGGSSGGSSSGSEAGFRAGGRRAFCRASRSNWREDHYYGSTLVADGRVAAAAAAATAASSAAALDELSSPPLEFWYSVVQQRKQEQYSRRLMALLEGKEYYRKHCVAKLIQVRRMMICASCFLRPALGVGRGTLNHRAYDPSWHLGL